MRILLISDIHGNLPALNAVFNDAGKVDKVICLGDLVGYYPYVNEVIEIVSPLDNCICVMGNHDYVLLHDKASTGSRSADIAIDMQRKVITSKNKEYLLSLNKTEKLSLGGRKCFIFHGTPEDPLEGRDSFWEKGSLQEGVYFFGHSHKPFLKANEEENWLVVNPGGCGFPRDGDPRASYVIFDTEKWNFDYHRVEYPVEVVVEECKRVGLPERFWKSVEAGKWVSDVKI